MVASIQTPADALNYALRRMGYKLRVGSLYDGSVAAKNALDVYAQTRDDLLKSENWGFAERNVLLTLLKSAPVGGYVPPVTWNGTVNPPVPWLYEYSYPADAVQVRAVKYVPLFGPNFDPQPNLFDDPNDQYFSPAQRVIVCNIPNALCVYTGQITDLTTWEPDAIEVLAAALVRRLGPALVGPQAMQAGAADELASKRSAAMEQG